MKRILAGAVFAAVVLGFSGTAMAQGAAAELFEKKCASCHGKDGKGQTTMGQKLGIADLTKVKISAAEAEKTISEGNAEKKMPAYKGKITDDEIKQVAQYVTTFQKK
jgi:mono/diheme cytochrome c family protein